ncbi:hypothetical protein KPL78_01430 [Roseomonas sp. HJA6]|uniref:Polysaccharide chain length determinant N-terminal domain-containing protein n=1 Tax=Roseomonas alba TaxID=2846776 RepID=A0ABS7A2H8_9PROT|nr:hypothetical protein [Neoroseomonas alba]MBW6396483.1 hypothetical protein [Neoroseomonas alba]
MEGGRPIGSSAFGAAPRVTGLPTDLLGWVALLRRQWKLVFACAVMGMLAMIAAAVFIRGPSYAVTAKIMVNLGPEMTGSPLLAAREGAPAAPAMRRPEDSATGVEIFSNPRLIRDAVSELGLEFFRGAPPQTFLQRLKHTASEAMRGARDAIREAMEFVGLRPRTTELDRVTLAIGSALRIEPIRRTDVISVTLNYPDPHAGEVLLGRFVNLALAGHADAYRMPGATGFFRSALSERRAELRSAEDRLLSLRTAGRNPVWSASEQRTVLIHAEAQAQTRLQQLNANIVAVEAEIRQAEAALARLPEEIELSAVRSRNTTTDQLRARLTELRLQLITQQSRYGEASEEIRDIRRQADALIALLASEDTYRIDQVTTGVNQLHQALERDLLTRRVDLEGQRNRARELQGELDHLRAELRDIETADVAIADLEREIARLRRAVDVYARGYEDARIAEAMESVQLTGLRVIMPPTAEILPSSPSLRRTALLGLVSGLAIAAALVLLREYRASGAAVRGASHETDMS